MSLFHAERCYGHSNFKAELTLRQDQGVCPNQCYEGKEHGVCNTSSGECECSDSWKGPDCNTCAADWCKNGEDTENGGNCPIKYTEDYFDDGTFRPKPASDVFSGAVPVNCGLWHIVVVCISLVYIGECMRV